MSERKDQDCDRCNGDAESACDCTKCVKCSRTTSNKISSRRSTIDNRPMDYSEGTCEKTLAFHYVTQIIFAGIRSDDIYEVKLRLSPEIDMSTLKITVKNKNLRVTMKRSLGELSRRLPELSINEKSPLNELVRRTMKICENFLIPENIDGDKVRANMDNKKRILVLSAPMLKPCKTLRRRFSMTLKN